VRHFLRSLDAKSALRRRLSAQQWRRGHKGGTPIESSRLILVYRTLFSALSSTVVSRA
jgi:hypothetical protein